MTSTAHTARFDIDNLDTAAGRALREQEPVLKAAIARTQEQARYLAAGMTVTSLRDELHGPYENGKPSSRPEWEALFVKRRTAASPEARTLKALTREAGRDVRIAVALNGMMDAASEKLRDVQRHADTPSPSAAYAELRWDMDELGATAATAGYATCVLNAVQKGEDLRSAVLQQLGHALEVIFDLPGQIRAEGVGSVMKAQMLAYAQGAERFRQEMTRCLGRHFKITMDLLMP